ncbi:MAG: hypothetical protein M0Z31_05290 [Clostridia bacterium]|nr:hypothetical protein [Clostridia bacterium]
MAKIQSQSPPFRTIELIPHRFEPFEEKDEPNFGSWVISSICLKKEEKTYSSLGSYFQMGDFIKLIKVIKRIEISQKLNFNLEPLEPNFTLLLNKAENSDLIQLICHFAPEIEYDNEKVIPVNSVTVDFQTNISELHSFAKQLNTEVKQIKYPSRLP